VGTGAAHRWLQRGQRFNDVERWADHIVRETWPADGWQHDVPCADAARVIAAVATATEAPEGGSLFDDHEASAEAVRRLQDFGPRAAAALAPGCTPRTPHGDPAPGVRPGETFTVAPLDAKVALDESLSHLPMVLSARLWADLGSPMVLIVRTWEGYDLASITRGCGLGGRT
jgi:hypothetical protein